MKREEKVLLRSSLLWSLGEGMLGPLFAAFANKIGGGILQISWIYSIYLLVTGITIVLIGKLSDNTRFKKRRLMKLGYLLNVVFTFGYLLVEGPISLLAIQIGMGISLALASPTWSALYDRYCTKKEAGFLHGLAEGEHYIAYGISIMIGGIIVQVYSFDALFFTMGMVHLAAFFYLITNFKEKKE